jgi:hypothetical protein
MITIEIGGQSNADLCADCGSRTQAIWGHASEDGKAKAAYFVRWTRAHRERGAILLLSIGGWGGGNVADRRAVALACRMVEADDRPGFMVVDAQTTPWQDPMLGARQTGAQVIGAPLAAGAFAIVDAIFESDQRFRAYLAGDRS